MTILCYPLAAPLLTGKRRSTVEPGTQEDSLWPAMQHGCTARDSSRIGHTRLHAADVYGHITLATVVPPPGEGRAPVRGYQPRSSGRPSGSGRGRRTFSVQNSGFFGSSGRGPGSGRGYQPRSSGRPSGSGRGRRTFSVQNSGFFGSSQRGPGSGRGYQPCSSGRPSGYGRGRGSFSVQNSGFFD